MSRVLLDVLKLNNSSSIKYQYIRGPGAEDGGAAPKGPAAGGGPSGAPVGGCIGPGGACSGVLTDPKISVCN